jgi:hypothetical protein
VASGALGQRGGSSRGDAVTPARLFLLHQFLILQRAWR